MTTWSMPPAAVEPPLISVVTVCLNAAAFLAQAMDSVLSQTYPGIEYIIIDGGSTDGTVEVIRVRAAHLAYWHSRPDRGLAHAFNLGLAQAHGDWILYLNADDYLVNRQVIEQIVPHLRSHAEADVVFGRIVLAPREGGDAAPSPVLYGKPWRWSQFRFYCTIPHQAAFTRRRYFARVGPFSEAYRIASDYEHFLRAGSQLRAVFVPHTVSVMRAGGLSLNNVIPTLREWRQAQAAHRAAAPGVIWGNYLARSCLCRIRLSIRAARGRRPQVR